MPFISGSKIKYSKKETYQDLVKNGVDSTLAYSKIYDVSLEEADKRIKKNRLNELLKMGISFDLAYLIAYGKDKNITEISKTR